MYDFYVCMYVCNSSVEYTVYMVGVNVMDLLESGSIYIFMVPTQVEYWYCVSLAV